MSEAMGFYWTRKLDRDRVTLTFTAEQASALHRALDEALEHSSVYPESLSLPSTTLAFDADYLRGIKSR